MLADAIPGPLIVGSLPLRDIATSEGALMQHVQATNCRQTVKLKPFAKETFKTLNFDPQDKLPGVQGSGESILNILARQVVRSSRTCFGTCESATDWKKGSSPA